MNHVHLIVIALISFVIFSRCDNSKPGVQPAKIPVVVITDLYHPAQDVGDNFDLITAYALPQIDLKAVILDCTAPFREPLAKDIGEGLYPDPNGPREPGFIPVMQLNYIFDRNIPVAVGPFNPMQKTNDKMLALPEFQQNGIALLIQTLEDSPQPIHIVSFGSARVLAVAYNRESDLFRQKVERIHISAGASAPDFLEWNVALDQIAIKTLLCSDLPIALYPCAAGTANAMGYGNYHHSFSYDEHNTFFKLPDLKFINKMDKKLQRYLAYAFNESERNDFLRAMENDSILTNPLPDYAYEHYVWETSIWLNVARLDIVCDKTGRYKVVPKHMNDHADDLIINELIPCTIQLVKNGYTFSKTNQPTNFSIFNRVDPKRYEKAMQHILPDMYCSFQTNKN
jgi:pyrimidine-specific ribonucleoside hydrolase